MKLTTIEIIKDLAAFAFIAWVLIEPSVGNGWAVVGIIALFSSYRELK